MRNGITLVLVSVAVLLGGCTSPDENPDWQARQEYPAWAYDAPFYYQPAQELKPVGKVGNNIPIYYVRENLAFIRHPDLPADWQTTPPAGYDDKKKPLPPGKDRADFIKMLWKQSLPAHTELWFSPDAGQNWARAGYFGQEQSHFLFDAGGDGTYWIRFVGAGQPSSDVPPGQPNEILVIDTHAPDIEVSVLPGPWEDDKKTVPHIYQVGETVTVSWSVTDMNLARDTVKLSTAYARFPNNLVWSEYPKPLRATSSMKVKIPAEAAHQAGLRFRIIAKDKAGNIGLGMTEIMTVHNNQPPRPHPAAEPAEEPAEEVPAKKPAADPAEEVRRPGLQVKPVAKAQPQPRQAYKLSPPMPSVSEKKNRTAITEPGAKNMAMLSRALATPADPAPQPSPATQKPPVAQEPTPEMLLLASAMGDELTASDLDSGELTSLAETSDPKPPTGLLEPDPPATPPAEDPTPSVKPIQVRVKPTPAKSEKISPAPARPTKADLQFRSVAQANRNRQRSSDTQATEAASVFDDAEQLLAEAVPTPAKKPAPKPVVKTPAKKIATPAPKPAVKPVAPPAVKPKPKPVAPPAVKPKPKPVAVKVAKVVKATPKPVAVKPAAKPVAPKLAAMPIQLESLRSTASVSAAVAQGPAPRAAVKPVRAKTSQANLDDIPEQIQLGWPGRHMTLRSGVSRLLSWMPPTAGRYDTVELQFSSTDGKKWEVVASGVKPGRVITWTVPVVNSQACRVRLIGLDGGGESSVLATSEVFQVDTGVWETVDMGGLKQADDGKKISENYTKRTSW